MHHDEKREAQSLELEPGLFNEQRATLRKSSR